MKFFIVRKDLTYSVQYDRHQMDRYLAMEMRFFAKLMGIKVSSNAPYGVELREKEALRELRLQYPLFPTYIRHYIRHDSKMVLALAYTGPEESMDQVFREWSSKVHTIVHRYEQEGWPYRDGGIFYRELSKAYRLPHEEGHNPWGETVRELDDRRRMLELEMRWTEAQMMRALGVSPSILNGLGVSEE